MGCQLKFPQRHRSGEHGKLSLLLATHKKHIERRRAGVYVILAGGHFGALPLGPGSTHCSDPWWWTQWQTFGRCSWFDFLHFNKLSKSLRWRSAWLILEHAVRWTVEHFGESRVRSDGCRDATPGSPMIQSLIIWIREAELTFAEVLATVRESAIFKSTGWQLLPILILGQGIAGTTSSDARVVRGRFFAFL